MSDEQKGSDLVVSFPIGAPAKFNYAEAQRQLARQNELTMQMGDTSIIMLTIFNGHTNIHVKHGTHVNKSDNELIEFFRMKMLEAIRYKELHKVTQIVDI